MDGEAFYQAECFTRPLYSMTDQSAAWVSRWQMELVVVFKELLQRYAFEMGWDGGERRMARSTINPMEGGLPVNVRVRRR